MSSKWTNSHSESGILRKSEFKEKKEELFVFGYSCKLFRDDDRALVIDQGKHLIPWMGDETLKIDRYDARGALHELSSHEAPPGGFDWRVELRKSELDVEQLCDEERYRALHTDEDEEEMYKEEELKRLHAAGYGQVGFNYDTPKEPEPESQPIEIDEPFVPTSYLKALLPTDMILPESEKQNAIIEKTAKFIATQGAQMEILIKAKQGDNPQFQFLNRDSILHSYYTALIALVKTEKWPERKVEVVEEKVPDNEEYLHPSLASTIIESAPSIPSIHYKPSADCDYTLLISKMRGEPPPEEPYTPELAPGEVAPPGTEPLPPRSNAEISRAPVMYNRGENHVDHATHAAQAHAAQVYQQQYAAYYHQYMAQTAAAQSALQAQQEKEPPKTAPMKSTGLSLMKNYNTDSDSDVSDCDDTSSTDSKDKPIIIPPPKEIQTVIEKMASYVARNGVEFAEIVRAKGDPRFAFLEPDDVHHAYYKTRLAKLQIGDEKGKAKKAAAPVSFSIKKLKEPDQILPKPALPYESSSDEDSEKHADQQEKQEKPDELKTNIPLLYPPNNIPPVVVYKMESTVNNLPTIKTIEPLKLVPKPLPNIMTVPEIPKEEPKPIIVIEKPIAKVEEVKKSPSPNKKVEKRERESPKKDKRKEKKRDSSKSRERRSKSKDRRSRSRDRRSKSKDRSSKPRDMRSRSTDRRRSVEREKKRERDVERAKKKVKYTKDELESEIISLEDNSDDMIDLTGELSDSKGEGDTEVERMKQQERRRRAAEFLKKVGVDPAAAALPTTSLASAMVDTLESLRKKKAEEEEKRRKREKRRHRDRHVYDDNDKSSRRGRRRKYRTSDEEDSDYDRDGSKKRKRKKDKKSSKNKKKRRREFETEEIEIEEIDQPLPPNLDLTSTLKELRTSSPTKELCLQVAEEIRRESSDDGVGRRKKRKKEDREYSEGEWSSDSDGDSCTTPSDHDD